MADATGTLHVTHDGKSYDLRLTMLVLSQVQAAHGDDFIARLESRNGKLPDFGLMVDIVARALMRAGSVEPDKATLLADDMLTADMSLVAQLMTAAFPDVQEQPGNVDRAETATG